MSKKRVPQRKRPPCETMATAKKDKNYLRDLKLIYALRKDVVLISQTIKEFETSLLRSGRI